MFVCLNLGIWGSAFAILLNQVVGGATEGKNSEGGEMELGKNQNDPNLCSNITRLCFCMDVCSLVYSREVAVLDSSHPIASASSY